MGSVDEAQLNGHRPKKQILLNAFDMSTVGHLSPGQWKVRGVSRQGLNLEAVNRAERLGRIQKTSQQRNATSSTGSSWPSYSNEAASMRCF